jgi:hypothetical protein
VRPAERLVGRPDAVPVGDDTAALVKQGRRSVGVKRQYRGQLGKKADRQALVSLALARGEAPVCVGLRLSSCSRRGPRRSLPSRGGPAP